MTTVLEVSEADSVTGHAHSLAITAPERVTFVKGTSREETRWWADVLSVYPRSKVSVAQNAVRLQFMRDYVIQIIPSQLPLDCDTHNVTFCSAVDPDALAVYPAQLVK
ncbi:Protein outspread [Eumeta japonica]|uniref:Protein outspread n=1 Tax=Eumeta variegata TaxID=151549 RepID=A0A4C1TSX7_EUMVA|nr:Protein outspread [Eumeta japonica]